MDGFYKNKIVWLTGASSGIGEAVAFELARRGARVVITARREEILNEMVSKLGGDAGSFVPKPGDVEDLPRMRAIVEETERELGPISILIANAGTHRFTETDKFDSADYLALMRTNFGGTLHCIEAVLPAMTKRKAGQIVGVASLAGYRGLPRAAAYGASKAALINFLESIRIHLARNGIRVSIVNPGFVKTPLTDKNDFPMPFLMSSADAARVMCNSIALQKREIAFPFLFSQIMKLVRFLPSVLHEKLMSEVWKRSERQAQKR